MEKPEALKELIEELREEGVDSDIESEAGAYAQVKWADDGAACRLTAGEAKLLLANEDNVCELLDALDLEDEEVHLEFSGLVFPDDVMEILMDRFQTVDEV